MAKKHSGKRRRSVPKTVLRLPDLDQDKSAVLNQPQFNWRSTRVSTCDRGVHRMALPGAATLVRLSRSIICTRSNQVLAGGTEPTGPHESRMQNRASPYIRNFSLCCDN